MFSRNGKPISSAPHIRENLNKFFKDHPNAILDGELYCDKLANNFNKIVSLVKKSKPTDQDLKESEEVIEYWVYDAPKIGMLDQNHTFFERFNLVKDTLFKKFNSIKIVDTIKISNQKDLTNTYEMYVEQGYEGQMVRLDRAYENKRSKHLLKRKEFMDEEFNILEVVEGEGNRKGTAGYMVFKNKHGRTFKSNIKGDFDYLAQLLKDKTKLVGKKATIKFFNYTPDSIPRFPYVIAIDRDSYE